jgi:hypothetical protein
MQHICRSATIAGGAEMYGRQFYDFFTSGAADPNSPNHRESKASSSRYRFITMRTFASYYVVIFSFCLHAYKP